MRSHRFARLALTLSAMAGFSVAFASGCADDQSLVGGSCASGYTQCGLRCVDLESDPDHCGACDRACPVAAVCVSGVCSGGSSDGSPEPSTDATVDGAADGAPVDGEPTSPDATMESSVVDGMGGGGAAFDGTSADSTAGDASIGDASIGDASVGDTSVGNALGGDAEAADASGASTADASIEASGENVDASTPNDDAEGQGGNTGCAPGVYDTAQTCGDCITTCSGATPVCAPTDGGFACAALCDAPLLDCGGQCVDETSDSSNCGGCANVCASQICENSQCVGATTGGIIFIGHDFATTAPRTTQAQVLSNAVFIPQTNPLRVLSYERYANANAVLRIMTILNGVAKQLGRTLNVTETTTDADIPNTLSLQNFDVLLVPDQPIAPPGALAALGPASGGNWSSSLSNFAQSGGVVVVLDGGTGVGEMPAFVTGTGLLTVTAQSPLVTSGPSPTLLEDVGRTDVEGVGLLSPYAAGANSVSVTTEPQGPDVAYVIVVDGDAGPGAPVVVHKVF